jgi:hypothetical protein
MKFTLLSRARTIGLVIGTAAVMGVALTAIPAHADDGFVFAYMDSANIKIGADGSPGKTAYISISSWNAVNPRVSVDMDGLAGVATAEFPADCTASGTVQTCPVSGDYHALSIVLHPAPGALAGAAGTLSYVASADNFSGGWRQTTTVSLADGVDMAVSAPHIDSGAAKPGDQFALPVTFRNLGNQTAHGYQIQLRIDPGLKLDQHPGCAYTETTPWPTVTCTFSDSLAPGATVNVDDLHVTIGPDAYGFEGIELWVTGLSETGAVLPNLDEFDNLGWSYRDVANTDDVAALGATKTGRPGQVVTVRIGVKNNGPASLNALRSGGEPVLRYFVTIPAGITATQIPSTCDGLVNHPAEGWYERVGPQPGLANYSCRTGSYLAAGDTSTVDFGLTFDKVIHDATGMVSLTNPFGYPDYRPADTNPNNDKALIVVKPGR